MRQQQLDCVARVVTFRDIVNIVMGNAASFSRIQAPLKQFLLRWVTNNGEIPIEEAVLKLLDDNYAMLEDTARVASVKDEIDLVSMIKNYFSSLLTERLERLLQTYLKLGWKGLAGTNTSSFSLLVGDEETQSFITLSAGRNVAQVL